MKRRHALIALVHASRMASAQWVPQASGTSVALRGLSVVSPTVAWASGARGTVLHTLDGGRTWVVDTVPGASKLDFREIAATSPAVAHAMSIEDSARIFRTKDGGRTWTQQFISLRKGSFFDAIRFWDAKHGIAVSDPVDGKFLIITTSDGGDTWTEMPPDGMPPALKNEGAFAASGSCLFVHGKSDAWFATGGGATARVFHSVDRGRAWTVADTPLRAGVPSQGIFSVAFVDARHGIVAGGDYQQESLGGRNMARTSDGGATWTVVDSAVAPQGFRSAVTYVPGTKGRRLIAVGLNGTDVSSDAGRTWTKTDSVGYNAVQFASPRAGYAVGPKGRVARYAAPLRWR